MGGAGVRGSHYDAGLSTERGRGCKELAALFCVHVKGMFLPQAPQILLRISSQHV